MMANPTVTNHAEIHVQPRDNSPSMEFRKPEIPGELKNLPRLEYSPMIDFQQVDERIRRLTVRPESEQESHTIDQ